MHNEILTINAKFQVSVQTIKQEINKNLKIRTGVGITIKVRKQKAS